MKKLPAPNHTHVGATKGAFAMAIAYRHELQYDELGIYDADGQYLAPNLETIADAMIALRWILLEPSGAPAAAHYNTIPGDTVHFVSLLSDAINDLAATTSEAAPATRDEITQLGDSLDATLMRFAEGANPVSDLIEDAGNLLSAVRRGASVAAEDAAAIRAVKHPALRDAEAMAQKLSSKYFETGHTTAGRAGREVREAIGARRHRNQRGGSAVSDHHVRFTIDDGYVVTPTIECEAPGHALCHAKYDCCCEGWSGERIDDDGLPSHLGDRWAEPLRCIGTWVDRCNLAEWAAESEEWVKGELRLLVTPEWTGDTVCLSIAPPSWMGEPHVFGGFRPQFEVGALVELVSGSYGRPEELRPGTVTAIDQEWRRHYLLKVRFDDGEERYINPDVMRHRR